MFSLPCHTHQPTRPAALWLLGACLALWPADVAVFHLARRLPRPERVVIIDGEEYLVAERLLWPRLVRLALAPVALAVLIAARRIDRRDAGVALGSPRATAFWALAPPLVAVAGGLALGALAVVVVRCTGWRPPLPGVKVIAVSSVDLLAGAVLHWCVLPPLIEEPLYRGLPAAALERLGGRWASLVGCSLVWMGLHLAYGWPLATAPFYLLFWGAFMTWVYLRTYSLVTVVVLHGLWNLLSPILTDLVLLHDRNILTRLLGGP
jgi:membrane protease YdiL (CAAX protease family)